MTHTVLLNIKTYLAVMTTTSVGVLAGCEYCSPVLAILFAVPVVKLPVIKLPVIKLLVVKPLVSNAISKSQCTSK